MKETISITNDEGSVQLVGDEHDAVLVISGKPVQMAYAREMGTTMRYHLGRTLSKYAIIQDHNFSDFVRNGIMLDCSLMEQFCYILNSLHSGQYELEIECLDVAPHIVTPRPDDRGYFHTSDYGGDYALIATQSNFDESTVRLYNDLICDGIEPIVVVLEVKNSYHSFIIDGHHKLLAYAKNRKYPKVLFIRKLNESKISNDYGEEVFEKLCMHDVDFKLIFGDRRI